jgi:hypothetical protein
MSHTIYYWLNIDFKKKLLELIIEQIIDYYIGEYNIEDDDFYVINSNNDLVITIENENENSKFKIKRIIIEYKIYIEPILEVLYKHIKNQIWNPNLSIPIKNINETIETKITKLDNRLYIEDKINTEFIQFINYNYQYNNNEFIKFLITGTYTDFINNTLLNNVINANNNNKYKNFIEKICLSISDLERIFYNFPVPKCIHFRN